ncbi:MAG: penicillin-binding transpeptidase domain-containing protein [Bacillota bacterium]|nr:penicillin-binding transpeptidase domain-containing protein [Bacillota bacterium]
MKRPNLKIRKRIIFLMFLFFLIIIALIVRLGYIQLIIGEEYKKEAYEQWSRDITLNSVRGVIYDSKGKKLGMSIGSDTVVCWPDDVKKLEIDYSNIAINEENLFEEFFMKLTNPNYEEVEVVEPEPENKQTPEKIAKTLSEILEMDEENIYEMITSDENYVTIKRWISIEQSKKIKEANLTGISLIEDSKRVYPHGEFLAHVLGFTNIDQVGMYGIESVYNNELQGIPSRRIVNTDSKGRVLPYGYEEYFEGEEGLNVVLTIDETIQHFAEDALEKGFNDNNAESANIIIMNPNTGEILAMAGLPEYNPNDPRKIPDNINIDSYTQEELQNIWFKYWRNSVVNDIYEPGSTFKLITSAIALEENKINLDTNFHCDGYVTQIESNSTIKCWRYYNPHGDQNLFEALQNSCNDALAEIGLAIGKETFFEYLKALGFGEKTNVELNGEAVGIVNNPDIMKDVNLVTQSFGQGISVTQLQLATAISAISNGGYLYEPHLVKNLVDQDGNIVMEKKPKLVRRVFSQDTSDKMLEAMKSVVSEGSSRSAYVPGYSVGGKTGTAQKVIDGIYVDGKYITSFVGVAPTYDPEILVLMSIDEPKESYYASTIVAPLIGEIIENTMQYLNVEPKYDEEELEKIEKSYVVVPELEGLTIKEASEILTKLGLKHNVTMEISEDTIVKKQYPDYGTEILQNSMITLILN